MSTIGENIRALRQRSQLTQIELSKLTGLSQGQLSNYETGTEVPKLYNLIQIANGLRCRVDELDERLASTRPEHATGRVVPAPGPWRTCGLYGTALCADRGLHLGDVVPENDADVPQIPVPTEIDNVRSPQAFRASDSSMVPTISEGDTLFFDPDAEVNDGDIALVKYDDTVICKRWSPDRQTRRILLLSDAPGVKPLSLREREIRWKYRVCYVQPQGKRV